MATSKEKVTSTRREYTGAFSQAFVLQDQERDECAGGIELDSLSAKRGERLILSVYGKLIGLWRQRF